MSWIRLRLRPAGSVLQVSVLLALAAGGCASHDYMGISLKPGDTPPNLQSLARQAQAGDKHAQLLLGICFEEGLGVPVDRKRARKLYAQAALDSDGKTWVYVPPVGKESQGRVIPANISPRQLGLPEAKARLERLRDE